jgi:Actin
MYCGDETGSFVGEVGSHTSRFGYGGDDAPKFVAPSCCLPTTRTTTANAAAEQQHHGGPGGKTVGDRRRKYTLRLQCATSCYRWRGGAAAEADGDGDATADPCTADYRTPLRRAQTSSESEASAAAAAAVEPIVDPNRFLSQGESIDDWDAYASLWESAMDALRVRDPAKHNSNAGGSASSSNKSPRTQPDHASGLSSTNFSATSRPSSSERDAALVHPMLVIRPGFTHMYGTRSNNNNNNNTAPAHDAASEAMDVDDKDGKTQESSATSKPLIDSLQHQDQRHHHHRAEMERLVELFMEDFGARAVFVAPAPMLAAFSHGRQTALVVDVGASGWYVGSVQF